jgi:PAS domain S-box-containing protein
LEGLDIMAKSNDKGKAPAPDFYEQIFDSLSSGIIAFDDQGVITLVNRAAREHLGVSSESLRKGMRLDDLLLVKPFVKALHGVLSTHQPVSRKEVIVPLPDGGKKEIGFSASLLQGPRAFNGAVFIFVDMTERRGLERAAEVNRQLAQIGELTAGVVHELRNPLSVISGTTELLQRKIEPEDPRYRNVATIFNETKQLERLIGQFLGFAKPFELELSDCRPQAIAERVFALAEPRAEAKRVTVEGRIDPQLPEMKADGDRLAQALVNIVNNAVEVVPEGGRVAMNVRREQGDIVFEITDNGPGIQLRPGEDLFKPFFSRKEGGTGLGLAIAHRIVTAHAGTIAYDNRDEGGACFTVRIPIERGGFR